MFKTHNLYFIKNKEMFEYFKIKLNTNKLFLLIITCGLPTTSSAKLPATNFFKAKM